MPDDRPQRPPQSRGSLSRAAQVGVLLIAAVAVAAALKAAAVVLLPIVASLLLAGLCWPLRSALSRAMPGWLAAGVCSLLVLAVLLGVAGWVGYAATAMSDHFEQSAPQYASQYESARDWLIEIGVPPRSIPTLNSEKHLGSNALFGPDQRARIAGLVAGGLRTAAGALAAVLLTIFLSYLALLEVPGWLRWLERRFNPDQIHQTRVAGRVISHKVRRYFIGKTISGVISGGATAVWLLSMGAPMPFTFALLTLLMNYIPNIGALLSGIPASLLAVAELGMTQGLIVAAGLVVIEALVGNLVDPLLLGGVLRLSAFAVLCSLVVWGWAWGIAGALMAPLLTVALLTAAEHARLVMRDEIDPPPPHTPG